MSDQHSTARPAPQTPTRPSRPRLNFAVAAALTLVVACAVYVGGFTSTVIAILLIGLALDLQGASPPELWSPETFRLAMLVQLPIWILGLLTIIFTRRRSQPSAQSTSPT